jgi:hypothetical protein
LLQLVLQPGDVAVQDRLDGGVDRGRDAALVFAVFAEHRVAHGDVVVGPAFRGDLRSAPLVGWIDVGVKEVDDQRLAAAADQVRDRRPHGLLVERRNHLAGRVHSLRHLKPVLARDDRLEMSGQAVGRGARAATEFEDVAKPLGRDQPAAGDLALEERIGRRRRAVDDGPHLIEADTGLGEGGEDAEGLVVRGRRHLGDADVAGRLVDQQQVGKSAADVDADDLGLLTAHVRPGHIADRRSPVDSARIICSTIRRDRIGALSIASVTDFRPSLSSPARWTASRIVLSSSKARMNCSVISADIAASSSAKLRSWNQK